MNAPPLLSAQVVPSEGHLDVQELQNALGAAGFSTGLYFAGSFSITAHPELFMRYFGVRQSQLHPGDQRSLAIPDHSGLELSLNALAPELRAKIKGVLFTKPPDFGPSNP